MLHFLKCSTRTNSWLTFIYTGLNDYKKISNGKRYVWWLVQTTWTEFWEILTPSPALCGHVY